MTTNPATGRTTAQLLQFQMSKFRLGTAYRRQFADQITGATNAHLTSLYDALLAPFVFILVAFWLPEPVERHSPWR